MCRRLGGGMEVIMNKKLVAYFSASGTTARLAKELAAAVGADLFEIVPVEPYTESDLNWKNPLARCNREKIGKKDVPVRDKVQNMADYGTLFLGFPLWYWGAPNVVSTFVRQYDLSGKKIALFATSGGSDIGKTAEKLKPYLSAGAEIVGAKVMNDSPGAAELKKWAAGLGLDI